jgi:hypothetical protein
MKNEISLHYVSVEWLHNTPSEPVHLYYELDADRYERRKVEVYRDGTLHLASASHGQGSTFLAWEPHPPKAEIEADPEFRVREITAQEFDAIWSHARQADLQPVAG